MLKAGERLKEERANKGITIDQASASTKIRSSFLSAIEKGEYSKLPSAAYAAGFVRNYAVFLGLPEKEILGLFRREFDENKAYRVMPEGMARREDFPLRKFKLKQTAILGVIIFTALAIYIIFQYRFAFLGPALSISSPQNKAVVSSSNISVKGKTSPDSTVFVNDQPVSVADDGSFTKDMNVFPGDNKIIIRSVNRFGRETSVVRDVKAQ